MTKIIPTNTGNALEEPALFLNSQDASRYVKSRYGIPCSSARLAKERVKGTGPVFRLFSRFPIYSPAELDVWATAQISAPVHSTSAYIPSDIRGKRTGRPPKRELTYVRPESEGVS